LIFLKTARWWRLLLFSVRERKGPSTVKQLLVCVALLSVLVGVASAQVALPGDFIVASYRTGGDAVYAITPNTNTYRTIGTVVTSNQIRGVLIGANNTDYYVAAGTNVFKMTPSGVVTTVLPPLPTGSVWNDLDETGELLIGTYASGGLLRLNPMTATLTTVSGGFHPNCFCLDRDTGDIVVGNWTSKNVMRVKRDGTVTTVVSSFASPYAADFLSPTGHILISSSSMILRLDALNTLTTFATGTGLVKSLAVLANGNVAAGPHGTTIDLYDSNGTKIGTPYNGASLTKLCMVVEDEHNLWGLNTPTAGASFNVSIRFARHPGKPYVAAASFSPRPGIPVDARVVPLTPDSLFALSVTIPQIFVNFAGILDPNGRATPYVLLPNIAGLKGLRIYLAAVVVDPKAPSAIAQISEQYGVTIQ